jgi:hypothetical protein
MRCAGLAVKYATAAHIFETGQSIFKGRQM